MSELTGRLLAAAALLAALVALVALLGDGFVFIVAIGLFAAPLVNWTAFLRLRALRRLRARLGLPPIRSLRAAYFASLLLAIASTSIAIVAAFTVARAFPQLGVPAVSRVVYLIGLVYPLFLLSAPAVEWIALVPSTDAIADFREWDEEVS